VSVKDDLRHRLGDTAALRARLERQDTLLQDGARQRLRAVQQEIERLQASAPLTDAQQQTYLHRVEERGHLWRVLGQT
jgi:hypothetical protein